MILQISDSFSQRAIWLKNLSAKEISEVIRSDDTVAMIDFELLQLCTDD